MASALLPLIGRFGALVSPPPIPIDYQGLEYRWKNVVFRPGMFVNDAFALVGLVAIVSIYLLGKSLNAKRASTLWSTFSPPFSPHFRAMSPLPTQPPVTNGPSTYLHYLTGRRNLLSLHLIINLVPRHNLVQLVQDFGWGLIDPIGAGGAVREDEVVLDFTLGQGELGLKGEGVGVWAVVDKSGELARIRKERWDISFTRTQESTVPLVPQQYMILSESNEATEFVLNSANVGLKEILRDGEGDLKGLFKSLIITDQPPTRPSTGPQKTPLTARHLILTLRMPSNAKMDLIKPWCQVAFNLVDLMGKGGWKPELTRKLRKTRQDVNEELTRSYVTEVAEEAGETEEDKRLAKKREKRAAMSEGERKKAEELEKKRQAYKAQKKQVKSGKMIQ